jgi:hypothetical protein
MKLRATLLIVTTSLFFASCGQSGSGGGALSGGGNKKGTIVLYRPAGSSACKSVTTPYFRRAKSEHGNIEWKVDDEFDCQPAKGVIEIRFDKGDSDPLPKCDKKTGAGDKKIMCSLDDANPTSGAAKYSIWLDGTKIEDPELEIAM